MIDFVYWAGAALLATAATALWVVRPGDRTVLAAGSSAALWAWCALVGDQVERVFRDGSGGVVRAAAPVPETLRFLLAGVGVLSLLALVLYIAGAYPPQTDETPTLSDTEAETQ